MPNDAVTAGDLNYADTLWKAADALRGPYQGRTFPNGEMAFSPTVDAGKSVSAERLPWVQAPPISHNPESGCGTRCSLPAGAVLVMCRVRPEILRRVLGASPT
jgi:hypothetical protein